MLYIIDIHSKEGDVFIRIDNQSSDPIYYQIAEAFKREIARGGLRADEALPSIRSLAKDLRISVITTKRAFDDLERDGFICTVQGKGSFVAAKNREMLREELLKQAEQKLLEAIEIARQGGISQQELLEMFQVLCQGE